VSASNSNAAVLGCHGTALRRGRRVRKCTLVRIAEECLGNLYLGLSVGIAAFGPSRTPFGLIHRFELVVPCRFAEHVLDGRRCIVFRRSVDASDALVVSDPVSRTQLQPCDTVRVDAHEMQSMTRDLHHHVLHGAAVAPCKQQCLPAFFRQHVCGGNRERSAGLHSVRTVGDRLGRRSFRTVTVSMDHPLEGAKWWHRDDVGDVRRPGAGALGPAPGEARTLRNAGSRRMYATSPQVRKKSVR